MSDCEKIGGIVDRQVEIDGVWPLTVGAEVRGAGDSMVGRGPYQWCINLLYTLPVSVGYVRL